MKTSRSVSCAVGVAATLALTSSPLCAEDLTLHKVPPLSVEKASSYPKNLARYHAGAKIEAESGARAISQLQLSVNGSDNNAAEAALLCDDPSVGYALPAGTTTLLVALPKVENVGSLSLLNKDAQGELIVSAANAKLAASSPQWHTLAQQELSSDRLSADLGQAEAKYVRLTFNLRRPGRIAGLGLYGTARISDFTAPRTSQIDDKSDSFVLIANNLSDVHAKARALYVSSGDDLTTANNMIDDQMGTAFQFAANDAAPVTIIDLGKTATLRRLSAVYAARPGSLRFYVTNSLPGAAQNAPEDLKLDLAALENLKPVGVVNDDGTNGRAAVEFPAVAARYVLVRWTPQLTDGRAFSISEVAAFGKPADGKLLAANSGLTLGQVEAVETDGKTMIDGKTVYEPKNEPDLAPDSPREGPPPSLPQPPPFTFVPVTVPTSP